MGLRVDLATLEPRNVCLIKPSSLGDVVHATPVLHALRARWPKARLAWVVNRELASLIDGLPALDEPIAFDRARAGRGLAGIAYFIGFLNQLRTRNFDLCIDLQGLLRSALMCRASGAQTRVGLADAREGAARFYTHRIAPSENSIHAVDRLGDVARAMGANWASPNFAIATTPADQQWAQARLGPLRPPRIIFNVGARWETKRWPPEHFATVARWANNHLGANIVAVGAPSDRELVDRFLNALHGIDSLDLCGATSLPQLAAVAQNCELFITNDSGPMHVAAAVGARVLGVFTCTQPEKTGPYSPQASVVRTQIWCSGSLLKRCARMECMGELTPARVIAEVQRRLPELAQADSHAA